MTASGKGGGLTIAGQTESYSQTRERDRDGERERENPVLKWAAPNGRVGERVVEEK